MMPAMVTGIAGKTVRERLKLLNWEEIEQGLWEYGYAKTPAVLTPKECKESAALYFQDALFRSTIDMERYKFGLGQYRYFAYPLPRLVAELRTHAYHYLAPIANRWEEALGKHTQFPRGLQDFLLACHLRHQNKPTPLLLRYEAGGYNCLHQDLYGDIAFPLQLTCFLSRPEVDFRGGEFLLVEQRPRSQSRGEAIVAGKGEIVIFNKDERPVKGRKGFYSAKMRHGASRVRWGTRYALGVIFHDAA